MRRILFISVFCLAVLYSAAADPVTLDLELDLGEASYTFGLSTNSVEFETDIPNDISAIQLDLYEQKTATGSLEGYKGIVGKQGTDRKVYFYWNIASSAVFDILMEASGPMQKAGDTDGSQSLDWKIETDEGSIDTGTSAATSAITIYSHNPTALGDPSDPTSGKGRYSYNSEEIRIETYLTDVAGSYGAYLIFSVDIK